jgi:uncharacterized protein
MPANLSPEYKSAEAAFRKARDPRERLECLREMLRTIPKHKGTEHLQADIKARIRDLGEELEGGSHKGGARGGPALVIRPEGAAQVALLGAPNAGKSSLHARLTGSGAHVADYPFTTQYPEPGMMPHEDVSFQLVDLPAISPEHAVPWLAGALQSADAALLAIDLGEPDCLEQVREIEAILAQKKITLTGRWPGGGPGDAEPGDEDPFAIRLPTLLLANKADAIPGIAQELQAFLELSGLRLPALAVSAATGQGLGQLGPWLFANLGIVRAYTKAPGHAPDKGRPYAIRNGQTVADVARLIHRDMGKSLRFARVWGPSGYDGQHVGPDHVLADGDVVELHA